LGLATINVTRILPNQSVDLGGFLFHLQTLGFHGGKFGVGLSDAVLSQFDVFFDGLVLVPGFMESEQGESRRMHWPILLFGWSILQVGRGLPRGEGVGKKSSENVARNLFRLLDVLGTRK
jgi:hypothetical protein